VLARAAAGVFTLACERLAGAPARVRADLIDMTERQVLLGRCPADDPAPGEPPVPAEEETP
jgi:glutamate--cysteine ligase